MWPSQVSPCPCISVSRSPSSDNIPILMCASVRKVRPFVSNDKVTNPDNLQSLRVCVPEQEVQPTPITTPPKVNANDRPVAEVKWSGPGLLVIPAGSEYSCL